LKTRRPVTLFDAAAAAAVLAVSFSPLYNPHSEPPAGVHVVVEAGGARRTEPIAPDRRLEVAGPLGATVIEIAGGRVRVAKSPCPNQLCVRSGSVREPGWTLVCAPNRVAVSLEGDGEGTGKEGIDGIAR
jgi:hypothetical protein